MVTSVLTMALWYFITTPEYRQHNAGLINVIGPFDSKEQCQIVRDRVNLNKQISLVTFCYPVNKSISNHITNTYTTK